MADVTPATDGLRNRWKSGEWSIAGTGASRNPESDDFSLIAWIEMLDARIDAEVAARKAAEAERDELRAQLAAAESERELLLVVVTHAEALIDNQANTTSQAYAICNSLHNSVARWRNRKAREQADGE